MEETLNEEISEFRSDIAAGLRDGLKQVVNVDKRAISIGGVIPEQYVVGSPLFFDPNTRGIENAHDYPEPVTLKSPHEDNENPTISGYSIFVAQHKAGKEIRKMIVPGIIFVGQYAIVATELREFMPKNERIIYTSGMIEDFGTYPLNMYGAGFAAMLSMQDFSNARIIEFGSGLGTQLQVAAKRGAKIGLGFELPDRLELEMFYEDIETTFGDESEHLSFAQIGSDINSISDPKKVLDMWQDEFFDLGEQPNTALINMGPSYDGSGGISPHQTAVHTAVNFDSMRKIYLGGYAEKYLRGREKIGTIDYAKSDAVVQKMLLDHGFTMHIWRLPGGMQCIEAVR